jgi:hypothetical protein
MYACLYVFSLAIANDMGLLNYLHRKWLSEPGSCQGDSATAQPVTLELVQTAFIMAAVGVGVAFIALIAECCYVHCKSTRNKIPALSGLMQTV